MGRLGALPSDRQQRQPDGLATDLRGRRVGIILRGLAWYQKAFENDVLHPCRLTSEPFAEPGRHVSHARRVAIFVSGIADEHGGSDV